MTGAAALAGMLVTGGFVLVVWGLRQRQVTLAQRVAAALGSGPPLYRRARTSLRDVEQEVGAWLEAAVDRHPRLSALLPRADLRVVERSAADLLGRQARVGALALAGALAWQLLVGSARGSFNPVGLLTALLVGAVAFAVPGLLLRVRARERRRDFRHAIGAYLQLVALERDADGGPAVAVERAAAVCDSWAFERIRRALTQARFSGGTPWEALGTLSADLGVEELRDLAEVVSLAGTDGAAIYELLTTKAAALRTRELSDAKAEAGRATERMTLPAAVISMAFVLILIYPSLARLDVLKDLRKTNRLPTVQDLGGNPNKGGGFLSPR